ncbi:MAG: hypothetical protein AABX07_02365 [Nanoarchaeota archaeon]
MKARTIYELSEENLEKDIDSFIKEARKGRYSWDSKYGNEGLKIIKQYFKILKEKFKNNSFGECKICYEKLILFCLEESDCNRDEDLFGYEDLLARISNNFDAYIKNYFLCLVKTCDIEDLSERVSRYASKLGDSGFESDIKVLIENLDKSQLDNLEKRMLIKTQGMTKKDDTKKEILFFLLSLVKERKQKEKYLELCNRFIGILDKETMDYLIEEYDE